MENRFRLTFEINISKLNKVSKTIDLHIHKKKGKKENPTRFEGKKRREY